MNPIAARLYSQAKTPQDIRKAQQQAPQVASMLDQFSAVEDLLVRANETPQDLIPNNPHKVAIHIPAQQAPRFEKQSSQVAFRVAQVLFPPLMLMSNQVEVSPAAVGVGEFDSQGKLTSYEVDRGGQKYEFLQAEDGSKSYRRSHDHEVIVQNSLDPSIRHHETWVHQDTVTDHNGSIEFQAEDAPPQIAYTLRERAQMAANRH